MPRSDSGRAATVVAQRRGGGLNDVPKTLFEVIYRVRAFAKQNVWLEVSATAGRTTPAQAWDRRPRAAAPLSRGGAQNVHSQLHFPWHDVLYGFEAEIGSDFIPAQTGIQRVDHRSTLARCIQSDSGS